jgi:hypothetical protein
VLKIDAVPVDDVAIVGLEPFMFKVAVLARVSVGELIVKVPPIEEPMVIFVVEPEPPPVPILSAFVVAVAVTPEAILYVEAPVDAVNILTVCAAVAVFPIDNVVAAPPIFSIVLPVLNTSIDAPPRIDVAKVGEVTRTTFPEPVEEVKAVVVFAVAFPVDDRNAGCVAMFPARRARVPGVPVADA